MLFFGFTRAYRSEARVFRDRQIFSDNDRGVSSWEQGMLVRDSPGHVGASSAGGERGEPPARRASSEIHQGRLLGIMIGVEVHGRRAGIFEIYQGM